MADLNRIIAIMIKLISALLFLTLTLNTSSVYAAMDCYKDEDCASEGVGFECVSRKVACEVSAGCLEKVCLKKKESAVSKDECEKKGGKWSAAANSSKFNCQNPTKV